MGISDWWTVLGPPLNVLSVAEGSVVEQCSRAPGCLFDVGDGNPTQLYMGIIENHAIKIPINQTNQPGFNGMSFFFHGSTGNVL